MSDEFVARTLYLIEIVFESTSRAVKHDSFEH
jgi:hypothetical protein